MHSQEWPSVDALLAPNELLGRRINEASVKRIIPELDSWADATKFREVQEDIVLAAPTNPARARIAHHAPGETAR